MWFQHCSSYLTPNQFSSGPFQRIFNSRGMPQGLMGYITGFAASQEACILEGFNKNRPVSQTQPSLPAFLRPVGVQARELLCTPHPVGDTHPYPGAPGSNPTWDSGGAHLASEANSRCPWVTFGSSLTCGKNVHLCGRDPQ